MQIKMPKTAREAALSATLRCLEHPRCLEDNKVNYRRNSSSGKSPSVRGRSQRNVMCRGSGQCGSRGTELFACQTA